MGICTSNSMQTDIGFAADKGGKGDDGRRAALDMFQIDRNFKRVRTARAQTMATTWVCATRRATAWAGHDEYIQKLAQAAAASLLS
jgi:hypothetical protein